MNNFQWALTATVPVAATLTALWLGLHYGARSRKVSSVPRLSVHRAVEFDHDGEVRRFIVTHITADVGQPGGRITVELQDEASLTRENTY